jgi:hypothetical protein
LTRNTTIPSPHDEGRPRFEVRGLRLEVRGQNRGQVTGYRGQPAGCRKKRGKGKEGIPQMTKDK